MTSEKQIERELIGWHIDGVDWDEKVEGGLVLELSACDEMRAKTRRVTLGFTELGIWIEKVEGQ